jgi:hypothetical protein
MTPWIDTSIIRVGPIGPEERKAIDAQLVRLIAQHRLGTDVRAVQGDVFGAVTKPKHVGRKYTASPEHIERLREYNRRRSEAIRARKEAANATGKETEGCVLEVCAATGTAAAQERVAAT